MDKNILSGDVSTLREYRALVEDYNNSKVLNDQAKAEEKRLEKELAINKKNLKDDIEITIKKRRNEVSDKFDQEIDKDESKLRKIRGQRSKAKNKGIKARIAEETADLSAQNDELKANIRAALKGGNLSSLCGSAFYLSLFFTKGIGEVFFCGLMIILTCLIFPALLFLILPCENLSHDVQKVVIAVIYFVVFVSVFLIYKVIENNTKHKQKDVLLSVRSLRDQLDGNNRQIRKIAKSIRKDKNEDMYNLGDFDVKLQDLENDIAIISQNKADALKVFDETTRPAIVSEIEGRELPRIEELEAKYNEIVARHAELEDTVKQLGIKLSTEYESYVDKSFSDVAKIDELIAFMENGQATTVAEAIQAYKAK